MSDIHKGTVTITFFDGTERRWPDSYIIHEGERVIVHGGRFIRASFHSKVVKGAEMVPASKSIEELVLAQGVLVSDAYEGHPLPSTDHPDSD